tara:strand:- start:712 stop:1587 length:876 start_codon:yes stop_codon:yes gene_type:complete
MDNLVVFNNIKASKFLLKGKKIISRNIRRQRFLKKNKLNFIPIIFKNFTVKIAETDFEIKKAQHLRYKIFLKDKKTKNNPINNLFKRDFDFYDKVSDHIIIIDNNINNNENVVGTYRLLRGNFAKIYKGFYTEQEFDISNLKKHFSNSNMLELGRSCVHIDYRSGIILKLLWQGISNYINNYKIKILFGCASFHGTDPKKFRNEFNLLQKNFCLNDDFNVKSLQKNPIHFQTLQDEKMVFKNLPPLIKGYLRAGGMMSKDYFIDKEFNTIDFCVVVFTDQIIDRYKNKFLN